jgi:hypothetical protein
MDGAFSTQEPLPQTNAGTRGVSSPSPASLARFLTIKRWLLWTHHPRRVWRSPWCRRRCCHRCCSLFLIKILWQHTPITDHLTSITIYSNSIRDNILLASLLLERVKLAKKRGARIWSRRENSSILLNSRSPNQISSLSGAKCKISSPCGAMHFGQNYWPKWSSWLITQILLQQWGCSQYLVLDEVHVKPTDNSITVKSPFMTYHSSYIIFMHSS